MMKRTQAFGVIVSIACLCGSVDSTIAADNKQAKGGLLQELRQRELTGKSDQSKLVQMLGTEKDKKKATLEQLAAKRRLEQLQQQQQDSWKQQQLESTTGASITRSGKQFH
jgi:hypothetical protein